jgi:hypothetical protein
MTRNREVLDYQDAKLSLPGQFPVGEAAVALDSSSAVWNDFANLEIILAHGSRAAKAGP